MPVSDSNSRACHEICIRRCTTIALDIRREQTSEAGNDGDIASFGFLDNPVPVDYANNRDGDAHDAASCDDRDHVPFGANDGEDEARAGHDGRHHDPVDHC